MAGHVHEDQDAGSVRFVPDNEVIGSVRAFVNSDAIVERNYSFLRVIVGEFDGDGWKGLQVVGGGHVQVKVFQGFAGQGVESKDLRAFTHHSAHDVGFDARTSPHCANGLSHFQGDRGSSGMGPILEGVLVQVQNVVFRQGNVIGQRGPQQIQSVGKAHGESLGVSVDLRVIGGWWYGKENEPPRTRRKRIVRMDDGFRCCRWFLDLLADCFGGVQNERHGFAGSFEHLHAGIDHGDVLLLGIALDVGPAPAQIGLVLEAEQFQHNGPAQFRYRLGASAVRVPSWSRFCHRQRGQAHGTTLIGS